MHDETHILAWKNQLSDIDSNEELEKERERFARFRLTYTHQLSDIERLLMEREYAKADSFMTSWRGQRVHQRPYS